MCKECGDLYTRAGYQVIQVPIDTVTQELVNKPTKENDVVTITQETINSIGMEENDANVGHNPTFSNTQEAATENEEEGKM
jgi:hypothetical protein